MVVVIRRDHFDGAGWEVWLEPEPGDQYVGICAGVGSTREKAIESALCGLAVVIEQTRLEMFKSHEPV